MADNQSYIVAAAHDWNRRVFDERISKLPGEWSFVSAPEELSKVLASVPKPRYLFFLHWSWKVPDDLTDRLECVAFHMTDVPYGRGGSPLQNLIVRGHKETKLTALRMIEQFDAGPVYLKRPLDLSGTAREIYERGAEIAAGMVEEIAETHPEPVPQTGEPMVFRRRKPEQSELPDEDDAEKLYDFIRMLDAPGYPHAFVRSGSHKVELTDAALTGGVLTARAKFTKNEPAE